MQNPRQIGASLLSMDEEQSLSAGSHSLDAKMREALGEHYQGHVGVSALPGFLALATTLPQDHRLHPRRQKFLESFSAADLMGFSGISECGDLIRRNVPARDAIVEVNLRKLALPAIAAADDLERRAEAEFGTPASAMDAQLKTLPVRLDAVADDASRAVRRLTDELTDGCVKRVRAKMLDAIAHGLRGDDEMKKELEAVLEAERAVLPETINARVEAAVSRTRASCAEALQLFEKHLREVRAFESLSFASSFSHVVDVDTDNGVEWGGLVMAVVGSATILSGGTVMAVLAGIGSILGISRSLWNVFSSSFRIDQQRRALNHNLDEMRPKLRASVAGTLARIDSDLRAYVLGMLPPLREVARELRDAERLVQDRVLELRRLAVDGGRLRRHAEKVSVSGSGH